jgi:hypothetical protein
MSPTCSKSDLAGRNALSTAVLTISPPDGPVATRVPLPVVGKKVYAMPERAATHNRRNPDRRPEGAAAAPENPKNAAGFRQHRGMFPAPCGGPEEKLGKPAYELLERD